MTAAVRFEDVSFAYDAEPVLEHIDLEIAERDFVGVIGPNGGGKTTLLKLMLGLLSPTSGRVLVTGSPAATGRREIGYVPQSLLYDPDFPMRAVDVVRMSRLSSRAWTPFHSRSDTAAALDVMRRLGVESLATRRFGQLSGGQRQRILIARALLADPKVLILDEPTASVDSAMERDIYELLRALNERLTIILVSHDLGFVSAYVNRVVCLNRTLVAHDPGQVTETDLHHLYRTSVRVLEHHCEH